MTPMLTLDLPYPPTANNCFPTVGRRRVLSSKGAAFRKHVAELCMVAKCRNRLEGNLRVALMLYPPDRRRRDCDNAIKPLLDSLTHAEVWIDDSQIKELSVHMLDSVPGGRVMVFIDRKPI